MASLNKELQEKILRFLEENLSKKVYFASELYNFLYPELSNEYQSEQYALFIRNIESLVHHGLIDCLKNLNTYEKQDFAISISSKGLHYLEPNEGIQIVETINVKLDAQTLQALIDLHINQSNIPETEKSKLKDFFSKCSDAAIGKFIEKAIEVSLNQNPQAILQLIQQSIQ